MDGNKVASVLGTGAGRAAPRRFSPEEVTAEGECSPGRQDLFIHTVCMKRLWRSCFGQKIIVWSRVQVDMRITDRYKRTSLSCKNQLYTLLRTTSLISERIRDSYTCTCVYDRSTGAWKESDCTLTLPYEGWEPYGTAETCPVAKMFLPHMYSKDVLPVMRQNSLNQQGVTGVENSA
ncbi:hypothetical protein Bbelb_086950 [Branchiostoma belcheri]|nr:hypothetical protein Bbelb_086950 [Branchiostoma belcheri]